MLLAKNSFNLKRFRKLNFKLRNMNKDKSVMSLRRNAKSNRGKRMQKRLRD
jgi:hypothetical protein